MAGRDGEAGSRGPVPQPTLGDDGLSLLTAAATTLLSAVPTGLEVRAIHTALIDSTCGSARVCKTAAPGSQRQSALRERTAPSPRGASASTSNLAKQSLCERARAALHCPALLHGTALPGPSDVCV